MLLLFILSVILRSDKIVFIDFNRHISAPKPLCYHKSYRKPVTSVKLNSSINTWPQFYYAVGFVKGSAEVCDHFHQRIHLNNGTSSDTLSLGFSLQVNENVWVYIYMYMYIIFIFYKLYSGSNFVHWSQKRHLSVMGPTMSPNAIDGIEGKQQDLFSFFKCCQNSSSNKFSLYSIEYSICQCKH